MRIVDALRARFGTAARSATPVAVESELAAIRTYAGFIAKHPDMPAAHRKWFLSQILQSCEEIGGSVAWRALAPASGRNQSV